MRTLIAHRPSPAMVVACLALLVALGGTSIAAVTAIAPNSVGTAQIRSSAVTAAKIRNNNVTGAKIAPNAVAGVGRPERLAVARRLRVELAPGRPRRPRRPGRPAGPAGTIGPITVRQAGVVVGGGVAHNSQYSTETVTVNCNANEKAISAGTGWSDDAADRELWTQRITPIITNNAVTGYRGTGGNDSGNSSTFTLYVLCYVG